MFEKSDALHMKHEIFHLKVCTSAVYKIFVFQVDSNKKYKSILTISFIPKISQTKNENPKTDKHHDPTQNTSRKLYCCMLHNKKFEKQRQ